MKLALSRALAALTLAVCCIAAAGASAPAPPVPHPDKLVILSTTDVKGKTSPCGCLIPKGGLSRRAFYVDSLRRFYGQVLLVDNGWFSPEDLVHQEAAGFLMDQMHALGTEVVNVGDHDLLYGRAYLEQLARQSGVSMVSANLLDKQSRRPVFEPFVIERVGAVNVGVFGLMSEKFDLGPARDSLAVDDPSAVARNMVTELRARNVDVIVLLSQLGKVAGEELVKNVDGIDAVVMGRSSGVMLKGRTINHTIACYGGDQGHYVCRSELTLDANHHVKSALSGADLMGPEISDKPQLAALVKSFEDAFKGKVGKLQKEVEVENQLKGTNRSPKHFVGSALCVRCHPQEGDAWKTTSHSQSWATLVNLKQESAEKCITCHVSGFGQPGGFVSADSTPKLANVQCESCHGMGTEHDAFGATAHKVDSATCTQCHDAKRDPKFDFETAVARIAHTNLSGETLQSKRVKQPGDAKNVQEMLKTHGG